MLIPGAFMATDSMKSWVSAFAGKRTVGVFDQQGHGRTPDTPREMSYEQSADDAAAQIGSICHVKISCGCERSGDPETRLSAMTVPLARWIPDSPVGGRRCAPGAVPVLLA
jgi:hypothetical protein